MTNPSSNFTGFANSFQAIAKLRLESIKCLLNHLENPQNELKFIHIAGTNGKGSVCNFLRCILSSAGYRTGMYISPNLISVCERISIDGNPISDPELMNLLKKVEDAVKLVICDLGESPTQFEIWTAAAFLYFKEKQCDIVVLETGLGGTRDATNIIPPPLCSIITRLSLDHTEYLGNTLREIAAEKAGIIKTSENETESLCITSPQEPEALEVIKSVCKEKNNRLVITNAPKLSTPNNFHELFDYTSLSFETTINKIQCGICGLHQPENASLAIECALALGISPDFIKIGIESANNPGRFEIIQSDTPLVVYDGAHNKNGITALVACLKRYIPSWEGATFIMAFMGDKDISGAFDALNASGLLEGSLIYAVQVKNNPRAKEAKQICEIAEMSGISCATPLKSLDDAYEAALDRGKPIILCGSLYLYKDFNEVLKNI